MGPIKTQSGGTMLHWLHLYVKTMGRTAVIIILVVIIITVVYLMTNPK